MSGQSLQGLISGQRRIRQLFRDLWLERLTLSARGRIRSKPAVKHFPLPERMTARTLGSASILWNSDAACRTSLLVSRILAVRKWGGFTQRRMHLKPEVDWFLQLGLDSIEKAEQVRGGGKYRHGGHILQGRKRQRRGRNTPRPFCCRWQGTDRRKSSPVRAGVSRTLPAQSRAVTPSLIRRSPKRPKLRASVVLEVNTTNPSYKHGRCTSTNARRIWRQRPWWRQRPGRTWPRPSWTPEGRGEGMGPCHQTRPSCSCKQDQVNGGIEMRMLPWLMSRKFTCIHCLSRSIKSSTSSFPNSRTRSWR